MWDYRYMQRALDLAERGAGWTSPNPAVGAVVVRHGQVVGEGYHRRAGEPHAEVHALKQAGDLARGATLYVTLEPCNHYGRTPPCTEAILAAGIRRVVVATADANPVVRGRGLARLMNAGLEVWVGVGRKEARRLNEAFAKYITSGLPWVSLKVAMSLDGRVATRTGGARWITGPAARRLVHQLRHRHDAVLVGAGTVLADDPRLTVRLEQGRDPVRLVLDSRLRIPLSSRVINLPSSAPTWIFTTPNHDRDKRRLLEARGAEVIVVPGSGPRVDIRAMLEIVGQRGITSIMVEGGPTVNAAFLKHNLVDRLYLFLAPKIIGGHEAPGPVGGAGVEEVSSAQRIEGVEVTRVGEDWLFTGYPKGRDPERYWTL